ncbi:MAG: NgoFVII family restriction endonuclease [Muribaculaceae bacterium]|nr:NgoFVII family restriction endonuclease [Muribaculaceae bacterium]
MFYDTQKLSLQNEYKQLLRIVGSLSRLSSDSDIPYLYYRMAENIFCKAFGATNLARSDISIDASKGDYGIGLKTFLYKNGCCVEKVAEFNRQRSLFAHAEQTDILHLINTIAELRNQRITTTVDITGVELEKLLYHCVVRTDKRFIIYETGMDLIDIPNINGIRKSTDNTVYFNDRHNEYCFNISKSTLFKKFNVDTLTDFEVPIYDDPYSVLYDLLNDDIPAERVTEVVAPTTNIVGRVVLPLYSNRGGIKSVPAKSGLNQWNAQGRARDPDEVYIPIPAWIHKVYPNFFPDRDVPFDLILPDSAKTVLSAKVCQDGSKALMSNPNKDLGKWLLRKVLRLPEGQLLTYDILIQKGIDSIEISKNTNDSYNINFKKLGTYEDFENETRH